jgi:hypothetical protein
MATSKSSSTGPPCMPESIQSQAAVETFRGSGPSNKQRAAMLSVSVAEYDIADVRPLFGKDRA